MGDTVKCNCSGRSMEVGGGEWGEEVEGGGLGGRSLVMRHLELVPLLLQAIATPTVQCKETQC